MAAQEPLLNYRFCIEIDDIIEAVFLECKGLSVKRKVETYREGGVNGYVHQLPGQVEFEKLVLKNGLTCSNALWDWFRAGLYDGRVRRRNISILLMDGHGQALRRWDLEGAFPVKWDGPEFNAGQSGHAVETVELVYNAFGASVAQVPPAVNHQLIQRIIDQEYAREKRDSTKLADERRAKEEAARAKGEAHRKLIREALDEFMRPMRESDQNKNGKESIPTLGGAIEDGLKTIVDTGKNFLQDPIGTIGDIGNKVVDGVNDFFSFKWLTG